MILWEGGGGGGLSPSSIQSQSLAGSSLVPRPGNEAELVLASFPGLHPAQGGPGN